MKTRYIYWALTAIVACAACEKEAQQEPEQQPVRTVLQVGIADTKTHLGDADAQRHRKVYWSNRDQIAVNGTASEELAGLADDKASADFIFTDNLSTPYNVLYPASIYTDASHVTLPAVQTYKEGGIADNMLPLAGYSADGSNLSLTHLCAIVKISVKRSSEEGADADNIVSVRFKGRNNEKVSGCFEIVYNPAVLTATTGTGDDLEVRVVKNQATSTSDAIVYYLVVPARTYSNGFDVIVQDVKGDIMTKSKATSITLEPGHLYPMAEFDFVPSGTETGLEISSAEELIAFARRYNDKEFADYGSSLVATITNNIAFVDSDDPDVPGSYAAFNATGGIGNKDDDETNYFNGVFDGGNKTISGLAATVPVFAYIGDSGTVKNLTLGNSCSLVYSAAISEDTSLGAIAGYSEGNLSDCANYAPVTCSSTEHTAGELYIGGIVGRQYGYGTISGCYNYADVTCTAPGIANATPNIYMGGVAGTVERPNSVHTALIVNCVNSGHVKNGLDSAEPAQSSILHAGGVVGWIYSSTSSTKMEIDGLINTGNVTKTNNSVRADNIAVLVGGIVGGIHGATISDASGQVAITNSHVNNCRLQTGNFNNAIPYGQASHIGGFVAVARGNTGAGTKNISFSDDCYVQDVYVICRRGFAGGFVSWARGANFSGCKVLRSSVRGALANCSFAGGIAGCAYDCNLTGCTVLLIKEDSAGNSYDSYTLYAKGNNNMAGGIVAQARGTVSIDGCKAYIKKLVQGDADKEAYRGWIVGYIEENAEITIKDCAIGGSSTSATAVTLDADNFDDDHNDHTYGYFYGSNGSNATVTFTGTQSYWGALKTADITISSYATSHSWAVNESYSIEQGDVTLTPSDNGGASHNGVYNDPQWRFYQARGGGLTISVSGGHSLVKATFTYNYLYTGVLLAPDGATQISSGGSCDLSGTSAFFTIGDTDPETDKGQVRFTRIVVEYE